MPAFPAPAPRVTEVAAVSGLEAAHGWALEGQGRTLWLPSPPLSPPQAVGHLALAVATYGWAALRDAFAKGLWWKPRANQPPPPGAHVPWSAQDAGANAAVAKARTRGHAPWGMLDHAAGRLQPWTWAQMGLAVVWAPVWVMGEPWLPTFADRIDMDEGRWHPADSAGWSLDLTQFEHRDPDLLAQVLPRLWQEAQERAPDDAAGQQRAWRARLDALARSVPGQEPGLRIRWSHLPAVDLTRDPWAYPVSASVHFDSTPCHRAWELSDHRPDAVRWLQHTLAHAIAQGVLEGPLEDRLTLAVHEPQRQVRALWTPGAAPESPRAAALWRALAQAVGFQHGTVHQASAVGGHRTTPVVVVPLVGEAPWDKALVRHVRDEATRFEPAAPSVDTWADRLGQSLCTLDLGPLQTSMPWDDTALKALQPHAKALNRAARWGMQVQPVEALAAYARQAAQHPPLQGFLDVWADPLTQFRWPANPLRARH